MDFVKNNKFKFDLNHNQPLHKSVECSYILLHSDGLIKRVALNECLREFVSNNNQEQ